ncbi:8864f935-279e-4920-8fd5-1341344e408c [Thermothielavioides terrestris]|uniref:Uncharacterized protein n=2 Tax=Thermothielavioides terrestris TaxID=2587410 RepID=G2R1I2_THETT|nr:uncharacterized protein THITE_2113023 [Thermothielavioides terrestris NRRL 8126]AEO65721.1 hypothetical protein THITE_2113023 [Thermothielavioides terrestris NRRL 8126]SPQ19017.1 8864f935-279e-4920-8fd5-1341344e408c [Thermothielavioides terrestris]
MGTRHLICIFWKGKWYLAQYGQFDGYPEGQGVKIINFLSVARNVENLKAGLEHIYEPTSEELDAIWEECEAWDANRRAQQQQPSSIFERNMYGINQLYPSLARDTSAGILGIIARAAQTEEEDRAEKKPKKIPVHLELEFANDTLFCEWVYVIDLDKEVLEVYGGGERKHDGHRFKDVGPEDAAVPAFLCSFAFSEIYLMKSPEEFLEKAQVLAAKRAQTRATVAGASGPTVTGASGPTVTGVSEEDVAELYKENEAGDKEEEEGEGEDEEEKVISEGRVQDGR